MVSLDRSKKHGIQSKKMISQRQADLLNRFKQKETADVVGIVRVTGKNFNDLRFITAMLLELKTDDPTDRHATTAFFDDIYESLSTVCRNAYYQMPDGFTAFFPADMVLTMVSEAHGQSGLQPSPDFITISIEREFKNKNIRNQISGQQDIGVDEHTGITAYLDAVYEIRKKDLRFMKAAPSVIDRKQTNYGIVRKRVGINGEVRWGVEPEDNANIFWLDNYNMVPRLEPGRRIRIRYNPADQYAYYVA